MGLAFLKRSIGERLLQSKLDGFSFWKRAWGGFTEPVCLCCMRHKSSAGIAKKKKVVLSAHHHRIQLYIKELN